MRAWLALIAAAGCSGAGDDLPRTWEPTSTLPQTLWWLSFDGEGRPFGIGKGDQRTYRYDEATDLWTDLGPAPGWERTMRDHDGNQYLVLPDFSPTQKSFEVHRFADGAWSLLFESAPGEDQISLAFDAANNLYAMATLLEGPDYELRRWNGSALEPFVTGPATDHPYPPTLTDDGKTIYVRELTNLYAFDASGNKTEPWPCTGVLTAWCVSAPSHLIARPDGEVRFVTFNDIDGTRFWKAKPGQQPVLLAEQPEGYAKVRAVAWKPDGGLYASIAVDFSAVVPDLFHLSADGEWTNVVAMRALAANIYVRPSDGTLFSIDPDQYGMVVLR